MRWDIVAQLRSWLAIEAAGGAHMEEDRVVALS